MAAYSLYDVLRHLASVAAWPSEEDKIAAMASITEAEAMSVLGNVAIAMKCPHDPEDRTNGKCECGATIDVGHGVSPPRSPITRQGWR